MCIAIEQCFRQAELTRLEAILGFGLRGYRVQGLGCSVLGLKFG